MPPVNLQFVVKVLGWVLAIGPITAALATSFYLITGAAKDDESLGGVIRMGTGAFLLGITMLALVYFTDLLQTT